MFQREPLQTRIAVALGTSRLKIIILERRTVIEQLLIALSIIERRATEFLDAGSLERVLHLRISAKCPRPVAQRQIQLHVGQGGLPHPVDVLGTQRFVVEVPITVVRGTAAGRTVLQQVDRGERLQ